MSSIAQTIFKRLIVIVSISTFMIGIAGIDNPYAQEAGIITAKNLNLRPVPGTEKDPILVLPHGAKVRILGRQGDWLQIAYKERIGYILERPQYIRIESPTDADTAKNAELEIEKFREEATDIEKKLEASKTELRAFQKKETNLLDDLNEIDLRINRHRGEISRLHQDIENLDERISQAKKSYQTLGQKIAVQEKDAAQRIVALYKTYWMGHSNIIASADSLYEMFQRRKALEKISESDIRLLESLESNRLQLKKLLAELNGRQLQKMDAETEMRHQVRLQEHVKNERGELLRRIRTKKSRELAVLAALQKAAKRLDREIDALAREAKKQTPETGDSTEKPFASRKGLLPMPVKGKIIFFFGPYRHPKFGVVNFRSGIDIHAERGEPVTAVGRGEVIFSNWFKGYGNMIIIDHGENYQTVYAYLEERFKAKGDAVKTGDVIGTAGETGSVSGPGVHFEVRHHGKPVDPVNWIQKG